MRVAYLAAGAGGMYCGSCLRDNRLAATLIEQGKDVLLFPLYTPLRTDETSVSQPGVLFGGIQVYLGQRSAFLGWIARPFRWLLNRSFVLKTAMRMAGDIDPKDLGPMTLAVLRGPDGPLAGEVRRVIDALATCRPHIVVLPNLMFIGFARAIREAFGAKVICTLSGEDLFLDRLRDPHRRTAFDLVARGGAQVDAFVATSTYYADHCASHFNLPRDRIAVVPLGIQITRFDAAPAGDRNDPVTIGYLARICPEKGLHNLVDAFIDLRRRGRHARLRIAGYVGGRDRAYLDEQRRRIRAAGLAADVDVLAEIDFDEKIEFFRSIDLLCVPTDYHESKGLYVIEALAAGVPVVLPRHGAFPELVDSSGGGVLYTPGSIDNLADALITVMDDSALRRKMGETGRQAVAARHTAEEMARRFWSVCEGLAPPAEEKET